VANALPVKVWEAFTATGSYGSGHAPVSKAVWSTSCPVVFFVLDERHNLYVYDLAEDSEFPVVSEPMHSYEDLSDSESQLCLSSTHIQANGTSLATCVGSSISLRTVKQRFSRSMSSDEALGILLSI